MSAAPGVGDEAPRLDLPGIPERVDTRRFLGRPLVVEFIRGTW